MNRLHWTVRLRLKKLSSLTAFCVLNLSLFFYSPLCLGDTTFRDKGGDEIYLPQKPVIRLNRPGALLNQAPFHKPKIRVKSQYQGLEKMKILEFEFPEIPEDPYARDTFMGLYILDKDGQLIAFYDLTGGSRKAKVSINGIINYVQVYLECSKHGLWIEELQI